ncbi:MAG: peptidylprolyl isomerase [Thermoanaerobaculia bacterium]
MSSRHQLVRALRRLPAPLLLITMACGGRTPSPDAVAVIEGTEVTYQDFSAHVEAETESPAAALESAVLSRLFDQYLTERLLVHDAVARGLAEPGTPRRQALSALLDAAEVEAPGRDEVMAGYRAREDELALPERVRLFQVLTETREEAEEAAAELAAGAEFAEVARHHSIDASAPYGGYQGELARDELPEELADVVFDLRPGEVSAVVEADYGYHVFTVTERLPARTVPFEEARPAIERRLRQQRLGDWLDALVERARSRYTVEVYERNLPFEYRGTFPAEPASS